MKKIGEQIRFQQTISFLRTEFDTIKKKPTLQKLEQIQPQLKKLDKTIAKIEQTLMADRRLNRTDVRRKLDGYRQQRNQLKDQFQDIKFKLQKQNLIQKPTTYTPGKEDNQRLLNELQDKNVTLERDFHTAGDIINQAKNELVRQRQNITKLHQQWQEADVELTMIDQFMRMISNRNLLTKIILILLAIFLGLADIAILVMKIS